MLIYSWRFFLCLFLTIAICLFFWLGSRYPDLDAKAMMANQGSIADTISMWPIFEISPDDPILIKILYTTINWTNDNKKGMLFGIILGGLFLSLLTYFRITQKSSRFLDTVYGFILGTPIGVCVNCAAPVFKGILQSKRAELAFAMMLSSPTMNIIVLTMVFTLFPLYMGLVKVLFTLVVIFIGIPVISKLLGADHILKDTVSVDAKHSFIGNNCDIAVVETIGDAIKGLLADIAKNIWYIASRTAPLMLVAGLLGAIVSHLLPFDALVSAEGKLAIIIVATVGLFLPVPIAFDVILANALFMAGLSPSFILVLLCCLGIFSIYSFMIVWKSASAQWAISIASTALVIAIMIGFSGNIMHKIFYVDSNIRAYNAATANHKFAAKVNPSQEMSHSQTTSTPSENRAVKDSFKVIEETDTYIISFQAYEQSNRNITGDFYQLEGQTIGIDRGFLYGIRDYPDPFWIGRGTASGDFDNDTWVDIALGSDEGVLLYRNHRGTFENIPLPQTNKYQVYAVAFVDFNDDGWLDLFITTFHKGNYIFVNNNGVFAKEGISIPNNEGVLTVAPGIADINADGYLDIFNGNMALGVVTGFHKFGKGRANSITWGDENFNFKDQSIFSDPDGETMASLLADFNDDGAIDIYAGNDFIVPDRLYFGENSKEVTEASAILGGSIKTPFFSMGVDTGDFNNDLRTDFIITGTTQPSPKIGNDPIDGKSPKDYRNPNDKTEDCLDISNGEYRNSCLINRKTNHLIPFYSSNNLSISDCDKAKNTIAKEDCLLSVMWMIMTQNQVIDDCPGTFPHDEKIRIVCEVMLRREGTYDKNKLTGLAQENRAQLIMGLGQNRFINLTDETSKFDHPGGWTWNTKVVDLDNDGWVDIVNAEGAIRQGQFGFNTVLKNEREKGFSQKQFSWKLAQKFPLFSFTSIDFDKDGDLDIIGNSSLGPVQVYRNQLTAHNMISFQFQRSSSNRSMIGAKLMIIDDQESRQVKQLKMGGGYQSFDAPELHFGLGNSSSVKQIFLTTPEGKELSLVRDFPPGRYIIKLKGS